MVYLAIFVVFFFICYVIFKKDPGGKERTPGKRTTTVRYKAMRRFHDIDGNEVEPYIYDSNITVEKEGELSDNDYRDIRKYIKNKEKADHVVFL